MAESPGPTNTSSSEKTNRTNLPEEDDFSTTPFMEYGEFNESNDEEADTKFFQFGRFFGVSVGIGFETLDGYRGALWQGGFPAVDFKVHYWFDFNFAMDLGFYTATHYFDTQVDDIGHMDVNLLHVGIDIKYYFDTKNLSAAISFANPYILAGFGTFTKTQTSLSLQTQDSESSVGLSIGTGLEFVISPRKTYFELEGKMHIANFRDTYSATFISSGLPDLTGRFYTITGNILFTW